MRRYENGKIYSIRSYQTDEVYIGSTCDELTKRLSRHRTNYKQYLEGKYHYVTSFKLLEYEDHYIELVEDYPCSRKEELDRREGQIIRTTNNTVNMVIAGRTRIEYREDNKEAIREKMKQYYNDNREVIQQYKKGWYNNNKEAILQQHKRPITCECGSMYRISDKARHLRSLKHQAYESNNLYINVLFEE